MITGFNTDIEHEGIVYHVQTEDKGLETPLMLTLVYTRGEILASKRVRYDDLIASGFDEKVLAKRLSRQHKLICAAIRAGRLDELKKMSEREYTSRSATIKESAPIPVPPVVEPPELHKPVVARPQVVTPESPFKVSTPPPAKISSRPPAKVSTPPPAKVSMPPPAKLSTPPPANVIPAPPSKVDPKLPAFKPEQRLPPPLHHAPVHFEPISKPDLVTVAVPPAPLSIESLHLVLVDETNYRGGDRVMLRVRVENGDEHRHPVPDAEVIVKILGSTFRPLILQARTATDGIAAFRMVIPHFRSGRAAILIRVTAGGVDAELRRIIAQG